MKVQITKQEDFKPHIYVQANETVYKGRDHRRVDTPASHSAILARQEGDE